MSALYSFRVFPGNYIAAGLAYGGVNPALAPRLDNPLIFTIRLKQFL